MLVTGKPSAFAQVGLHAARSHAGWPRNKGRMVATPDSEVYQQVETGRWDNVLPARGTPLHLPHPCSASSRLLFPEEAGKRRSVRSQLCAPGGRSGPAYNPPQQRWLLNALNVPDRPSAQAGCDAPKGCMKGGLRNWLVASRYWACTSSCLFGFR